MIEIEAEELSFLSWAKGAFIEGLAIFEKGGEELHRALLGVRVAGALSAELRLFHGSRAHELATSGALEESLLHFNVLGDPEVFVKAYTDPRSLLVKRVGSFLVVEGSYLTLLGEVLGSEQRGDHAIVRARLRRRALLVPSRMAPTCRALGLLVELLVRLSRVEGRSPRHDARRLCSELRLLAEEALRLSGEAGLRRAIELAAGRARSACGW
ncbi:MAG: DUF447 family protein [Fervidicoccaceae archaeon]